MRISLSIDVCFFKFKFRNRSQILPFFLYLSLLRTIQYYSYNQYFLRTNKMYSQYYIFRSQRKVYSTETRNTKQLKTFKKKKKASGA